MFRTHSPDQLVEFLAVVSGHQDERGATVAATELTVYLERAPGAGRRAA